VVGRFKYLANVLTFSRIAAALSLPLVKPLSALFFVIYFFCGITDFLDGKIARRTQSASRFGETLDSVADLILLVVMLAIFAPLLPWQPWIIAWVGAIFVVHAVSLAIGFHKYRAFTSLHTYANKVTGICLFCFPMLFLLMGLVPTAIILCTVASLSSLDELLIIIWSKELDKNVVGLFFLKRYT